MSETIRIGLWVFFAFISIVALVLLLNSEDFIKVGIIIGTWLLSLIITLVFNSYLIKNKSILDREANYKANYGPNFIDVNKLNKLNI